MSNILKCPSCLKPELNLYMGGQLGQYECRACGYIGPIAIEETIETDSPKYYRAGFDSWLSNFYDFSFRIVFFFQHHKLRSVFTDNIPADTKKILDLATGTGGVAIAIKKKFSNTKIIGIDLANAMIEIAKKKAKKQNLKITFQKENIEKTPFKSNEFDAVTISFGLHELPLKNRPNVITEAHRVLKKKGRFMLMDFHTPKNLVLQILFKLFLVIFEEPYAKTLLRQNLKKEFKKAGFMSVQKHTYHNNLVQMVIGTK